MNYNFSPGAVKRLLAARSARFSTTRSKPILVMPVFIPGGETQSSEALAAAWRAAWDGVVRQKGLVPMRLPASNPADSGSVIIEPASLVDRDRLAELARRNDVDDVLVSVATVVTGADAPGRLLKTSSMRYPSSGAPQPLPDKVYPLAAPEDEAAVLTEAAAAVAQDVQNNWRRSSAVSLKPVSRTIVRVQTVSLQDWVEMRRRLIELPQAKGVDVLSVGREYAMVQISYPGGPEDLVTAFAKQGLSMRNEDGNWIVSEASALPLAEDAGEPATAREEEPAR
jgi:hypothetical protein